MLIIKHCNGVADELRTITKYQNWLESTFGEPTTYVQVSASDVPLQSVVVYQLNNFDNQLVFDWESIRRQYVEVTGDKQEKMTITARIGSGWKLINSCPHSGEDSYAVYLHFDNDNDAVHFKLACL